jgi:hypothetical protein
VKNDSFWGASRFVGNGQRTDVPFKSSFPTLFCVASYPDVSMDDNYVLVSHVGDSALEANNKEYLLFISQMSIIVSCHAITVLSRNINARVVL